MSPSVPAYAEAAAVRDPARLAEIARLGLATGSDDAVLRAALRDAGERCGAPVALVNIVLDDAAAILAAHGLAGWSAEATGTPVEWSFCRHTVACRGVFAVADTARDAHTRDNPLVRYDGVGSYAGAPLVTSRGHVVGALCVLGPAPRPFSGAQLATLRGLADVVVRHLEERAAAPRSP